MGVCLNGPGCPQDVLPESFLFELFVSFPTLGVGVFSPLSTWGSLFPSLKVRDQFLYSDGAGRQQLSLHGGSKTPTLRWPGDSQRESGAIRAYRFARIEPIFIIQQNPRVRKIRVRNSGAGDGCANFMDAWKNASVLQEKAMSIKFLVLGGGILGFWGGGVPILIFWARGFF